ncbi:MAG: molybdate ABC transporter substrate-binding protein [Actinomycetota bacterium]
MRRATLALACAAALLVSCGGDGHELTVSAAASLTGAFTELGAAFERANDGMRVTFNFGPSDGLATQILDGAPVDVFASASPRWMDVVERDGTGVTGRAVFARNELAVLVPADDPAGVDALEDLATPGLRLVLAAEGVPAGDYAREVLANAGIAEGALANVVSNEENVKGVLTKVLSGDADAGIAYATDVTPELAGRVRVVRIPDEVNVIATYPIAVVNGTEEADLAARFVDFVLGEGQRTLAEHGFLPPA